MGKGDDPNCLIVIDDTAQGAAADLLDAPASHEEIVAQAWELRAQAEAAENPDPDLLARLSAAENLAGGRVFRVPVGAVADIEKIVARAQRAVTRLGGEPPHMHLAGERDDTREIAAGLTVGRRLRDIVLDCGDIHAGDGWRFVAVMTQSTIDDERTNVIRRLPGETSTDLTAFHTAAPVCEHCGLRRRRNETFIVQGPDGAVRQVGRSCLTDYIGADTPEKAARHAELILGTVEEIDKISRASGPPRSRLKDPEEASVGVEYDSAGRPVVPSLTDGNVETEGTYDPVQYLAFAAASVRRDGFVSRRDEREKGVTATATDARKRFFAALRGDTTTSLPDAADVTYAQDAVRWARDMISAKPAAQRTPFESSVLAMTDGRVTHQQLPTVAAVLGMYEREQDRRAKAAASPSRHVGTLKEMHDTVVTVTRKTYRDRDFGQQTYYMLRDQDGNEIRWYSSARAEMEEGGTYRLRGRISKHTEWQGVPQTVMKNCRFEPIDSE